jgi:hypothetical protein
LSDSFKILEGEKATICAGILNCLHLTDERVALILSNHGRPPARKVGRLLGAGWFRLEPGPPRRTTGLFIVNLKLHVRGPHVAALS